jgi:hypothetical protein
MRPDESLAKRFPDAAREAVFSGEKGARASRDGSGYPDPVLAAGFMIKVEAKPMPAQKLLEIHPSIRDELRRPTMLLTFSEKNR